jgi:hypothetical protein
MNSWVFLKEKLNLILSCFSLLFWMHSKTWLCDKWYCSNIVSLSNFRTMSKSYKCTVHHVLFLKYWERQNYQKIAVGLPSKCKISIAVFCRWRLTH